MTPNEEMRDAYRRATCGEHCPLDVLNGISDPAVRRPVEVALAVLDRVQAKGIEPRDAIHETSLSWFVKGLVAELVCPEHEIEFTGSRVQRMEAREAHYRRAERRRDDQVLANAAALDPSDHSDEAIHLREVAASVRDHREQEIRNAIWAAEDAGDLTQVETLCQQLARIRQVNDEYEHGQRQRDLQAQHARRAEQ